MLVHQRVDLLVRSLGVRALCGLAAGGLRALEFLDEEGEAGVLLFAQRLGGSREERGLCSRGESEFGEFLRVIDEAGATFLKVSGTGAITPSTAAGTALTIVSGQWAELTDVATQPRCGTLIKQLTPYLPGNVRVGIEVCEPVFDKIV